MIVNDKKLKNIYENKTFYYGGDYKFKPFVYYHFATPSNGREFLVLWIIYLLIIIIKNFIYFKNIY